MARRLRPRSEKINQEQIDDLLILAWLLENEALYLQRVMKEDGYTTGIRASDLAVQSIQLQTTALVFIKGLAIWIRKILQAITGVAYD